MCEVTDDRVIGSYTCLLEMLQEVGAHGWLRPHHFYLRVCLGKRLTSKRKSMRVKFQMSMTCVVVSMVHHDLAHFAQSGLWGGRQC